MMSTDCQDPSYHDLYITTSMIPRTSIFNLPFSITVTCSRITGWEVWERWEGQERILGREYPSVAANESGLRLDVNGVIVVDSLSQGANPSAIQTHPIMGTTA